MPLNSILLWEAEIITPASAPYLGISVATAGVGMTPSRCASAPTEQIPATNAASNTSLEMRVSLPIKILGLCCVVLVSTSAAALPIFIAVSQVSSVMATPLAPSVPNSLPIQKFHPFVLCLFHKNIFFFYNNDICPPQSFFSNPKWR